MVPPARSARHGACATMAGPLTAKVTLRMRCFTTLQDLTRDVSVTQHNPSRTGSGLGLIRLDGGGQDLWNRTVYICFRCAVTHDAGAQRKFPVDSRIG